MEKFLVVVVFDRLHVVVSFFLDKTVVFESKNNEKIIVNNFNGYLLCVSADLFYVREHILLKSSLKKLLE